MGKNNAERQRAYRQRHLQDVERQSARINTVVSVHAKRTLERLACCYGVTQQAMLEKVLEDAESRLLDQIPMNQHNDYYDKKISVTQ